MADSGGTRKLCVTSCAVAHSGIGSSGKAYTIYEVFAVDESGTPVEAKLRSFDDLELNKLIEYDVKKQVHPRHGTSYTLSLKGGGRRRTPAQESQELKGDIVRANQGVAALTKRIAALEQKLVDVITRFNDGLESGDTTPIPTEISTELPASGALAGDQDIPF